jgi:hypothetical protein
MISQSIAGMNQMTIKNHDLDPLDPIVAAELEMMERRTITIPAENWPEFVKWMERPPERIQDLVDLFSRRPTWENAKETGMASKNKHSTATDLEALAIVKKQMADLLRGLQGVDWRLHQRFDELGAKIDRHEAKVDALPGLIIDGIRKLLDERSPNQSVAKSLFDPPSGKSMKQWIASYASTADTSASSFSASGVPSWACSRRSISFTAAAWSAADSIGWISGLVMVYKIPPV